MLLMNISTEEKNQIIHNYIQLSKFILILVKLYSYYNICKNTHYVNDEKNFFEF
jgi:hypothetical protein